MQDETMVVLAEYNTITEAEIAKSMLDSAGIWSMIRNEYMSAIYPIGTMPAALGRLPAAAEGCSERRVPASRPGRPCIEKGVRAGCTYTLFDFTRHAVRRRTGQVKLIRYS